MPSSTGLHKLFVRWMCVLVFSKVSEGMNCKKGFVQDGNNCYLYTKETYNWFEAKVACVSLGGRVVEFDTPDKIVFVGRMVAKNGGSVWTGVNDFAEETLWSQSSQASSTVDFCSYWAKTEPNDVGSNEDCAAVDGNGRLHDISCGTQGVNVLCEILGSPLSSIQSPAAWPGSSWRCPNIVLPVSSSPLHGISLLHVLLSTAVGFRLTIGYC